jgi:hypothetical protein
MSGMSDEELRRHFQALRERDLAQVPSFAELSRRPAAARRRPAHRARRVLVGGLGALAAAAMFAVHIQRRRDAAWLEAAAAISNWRPPSDALLHATDRAPLGGAATLGSSVLDSIIPPSRED